METHPTNEQLTAFVDGVLGAPEAAEVASHLQTCASCAGMVAAVRATLADLASLPDDGPSPHQSWSLRQAIARERRTAPARWQRWALSSGAAAAVIGVIALAVVASGGSGDLNEGAALDAFAAPPGEPLLMVDGTDYSEASARALLGGLDAPKAAPLRQRSQEGYMAEDSTEGEVAAGGMHDLGGPSTGAVKTCESMVLQDTTVRPLDYRAATYEGTPAFLMIYAAPADDPVRHELWVVAQADCRVLLFAQRQL